jgi:hypothetical protein
VFVLHCSCVYHHVTGECQRFMSHANCKVNGMEINTRHCLYPYFTQIASVCARYKRQTIAVCCLCVSEGSREDTTLSCSIHVYTIFYACMHTFYDALHVSTVSIVGELGASQPGSDNRLFSLQKFIVPHHLHSLSPTLVL